MTSTSGQQTTANAPAAPNGTSPSYASAASAQKKQSKPVVAGGPSTSTSVSGSSQHAKSGSVSQVNGRPIMPAVPTVAPAVAVGTTPGDNHARKPSVTVGGNNNNLSANGNGSGPKIQFGFQASPAVSHSTPQSASAPIAIPNANNGRVASPASSPTPIPVPGPSGGRPPSGAQSNNLTFGSFQGNGDVSNRFTSHHVALDANRISQTHMRRTSAASQNPSHIRNESSQSMANDPSNQGIPQGGPPGRGGFHHSGRGRGGYNPNYNNHNQMGYPPGGSPAFRPSHPSQGRGGMAQNFSPRPTYAGTPPMGRASPALSNAMPVPGAQPYYFPGPNMGPPMQNVTSPLLRNSEYIPHKPSYKKRKNQRSRDGEKSFNARHRSQSNDYAREGGKPRHFNNKRGDQHYIKDMSHGDARWTGQLPAERGERVDTNRFPYPPYQNGTPFHPMRFPPMPGSFDPSLTGCDQQFYPPPHNQQYDPRAMPQHYMYSMPGQAHSPAPNFQAPFNGPPQTFAPQPMSRTQSQASEPRPTSSTGQTPQQANPQLTKPVVASSPQFTKPPKKSAVTIRNANGDIVDLNALKAPTSPAPSTQSKTPPVIASTPTPPPKSATPKTSAPAHTRTDSTATKTQAEVQNEFKEKIARQIAADEKAKEDESKAAETKAAETKAAEEKAAEEARAAEEKAKEEEKLKQEQQAAEEKKAAEEAEAKAAAEKKAQEAPAPAPAAADEEDEIERMIREMEEADAKREAEQAKITAEKKAVADAKKKAEEEAKKAAGTDDKLKEAEREAERLEEEKERKRRENEGQPASSVGDALAGKLGNMSISDKESKKPASLNVDDKPVTAGKVSPGEKRGTKPAPLNLNTSVGVEPPQPSAALQSLKTAKRLQSVQDMMKLKYPEGISSPNPALNAAVSKKGTSFKYDPSFLLQFQTVFTEKPSLEFGQQVKNLIGDGDGGRSASSRTPATARAGSSRGGFPIGQFGVTGGKPLPSGTTSEQRFAMSQGQMPRPAMGSMNSFARPGGSFPGGNMMSRTSSSTNMASAPRTNSRRGAGSKRNTFDAKAEEKAAKTMPLTAGMKFEAIKTSETGWKPASLTQKATAAPAAGSDHMDPPMVQRKVKAALNKMTPENFDRISQSILDIAAQSKEESDGRTLRQVIQLTFEKATDEAHWASMYAKFAKRMLETMSSEVRDENIKDKNGNVVSGGALFRKYLLNRCQEEFERGWKTQLPEPGEGESKEAAMMSDEYYTAAAAKRRGLGLVQFIGELYKLSMLTERIMHECVRKLVDFQGVPDEAEVESLSKLLRTIGGNLDSTEKGRVMMEAYFSRIQQMIDMPDINSRLKFMLMDVVDLRRANWISKETNKGPKTLEEVRAEAEAAAAQKAAEAAKTNQRGGSGRFPMGRGDARQFSSGYTQQAPNTVGMDDLRRLKGSVGRTASQNISLGPTSMFSSRSNSGRRLGPGGSLSRGAEDSGASSRTGTPPTQSSTNAFR